jgi:hypothetical protein
VDAIAYMTWDRIVPWKILALKARPNGPLVPVGFGANRDDFFDNVRRRSRIWVVTRIGGELSLAGRVTVDAMLESETAEPEERTPGIDRLLDTWKYVARADPRTSRFFEANLVTDDLRFSQNRTIHYRSLDFSESIRQASKTIFLSYRWKDARRYALLLARALRRNGMSPWIDALSMTGFMKKKDPEITDARLEKLLELGVTDCRWALVIPTRRYGRSPWTRFEVSCLEARQSPPFLARRASTLFPEGTVIEGTIPEIAESICQACT